MVAEMELGFIRDRQRAGIEAAKSKGVYKGRSVKLDWNRIRHMDAEGKGPTEIATAIGCSRGMVYKVLGACLFNDWPICSESDSFQTYEQGFSPLEDR